MTSIRMAATMLFALICLMGLTQPAQAAQDPGRPWEWGVTCYSFSGDQAAAQTYYDENGQPADLDWNGNGIACEGEGDGDYTPHATAGPDPTCGTWLADPASAQEYYDTHGAPYLLDWNGNGIACEDGNDGDFLPWPDSGNSGATVWPGMDCSEFAGGEAAAVEYYNAWGGPDSLDPNQDGIACNEGAGPSAWPEWTCEDFPGSIEEAIAYFETNGGPATLDPDGDGIACNEGEGESDDDSDNGPSAWPAWTCYTFPDGWEAAIDYYNTNGGPSTLDADGDGTPCEPNGDDEVVECRDLGGPQHIAQDYYEANGYPENLDLDGDGWACMNEADGYWGDTPVRPASLPNEDDSDDVESEADESSDETATDESSDDDTEAASDGTAGADSSTSQGGTTTVVKLPSTGAGSHSDASMPLNMLVGIALIAVVLAWTSLRVSCR